MEHFCDTHLATRHVSSISSRAMLERTESMAASVWNQVNCLREIEVSDEEVLFRRRLVYARFESLDYWLFKGMESARLVIAMRPRLIFFIWKSSGSLGVLFDDSLFSARGCRNHCEDEFALDSALREIEVSRGERLSHTITMMSSETWSRQRSRIRIALQNLALGIREGSVNKGSQQSPLRTYTSTWFRQSFSSSSSLFTHRIVILLSGLSESPFLCVLLYQYITYLYFRVGPITHACLCRLFYKMSKSNIVIRVYIRAILWLVQLSPKLEDISNKTIKIAYCYRSLLIYSYRAKKKLICCATITEAIISV